MIWTFAPGRGSTHLAVLCDDVAEYDQVVGLGRVRFDGQACTVVDAERSTLWIRFLLDEPFRMPPLHLHFEDVEVAEAIAQTGWYTFEGGLYTAALVEPGVLALDQVFAGQAPAPQYHGRALLEPVAEEVAA